MSRTQPKIFPLGDSALTVEFGNTISPKLNQRAIALADHFERNRFPGFIESVPAYASTTIFYDPVTVARSFFLFSTAFEAVKDLVAAAVKTADQRSSATRRLVEIPVTFESEFALDLDFVATSNGLTAAEVIDVFLSTSYRVYMLGFLPGFSYMGEVDERIATPRKETPRTLVSKGSVGIAGRQTGIYSLASPGGWQIIGRTEVELFAPNAASPSYLQPGDEVRFISK